LFLFELEKNRRSPDPFWYLKIKVCQAARKGRCSFHDDGFISVEAFPMSRSKKILAFLVIFLTGALFFIFQSELFFPEDKEALHIAVAGPMSGKDAAKGAEMLRGIRFCIDEVNQEGGIRGKKIRLAVFDDQNDPFLAMKSALEIIEDPKVLMVIGHFSSETSAKSGDIYRIAGIPAISASATGEGLTEWNDWYFRVIFNNRSQGIFLASYVKEILEKDFASIIYTQDVYGISLAKSFKTRFRELGGTVRNAWRVDPKADNLDAVIGKITEDIAKRNANPGMIFLATHADEAVKIMVSLRRKGLKSRVIGGDALGDRIFAQKFEAYPEERADPGYFSDGIYATSAMIFDVAGEKAQKFRDKLTEAHGREPGWITTVYYEAALVAVQAMKMAAMQGTPEHLGQDRQKIRDALASLNRPDNAVKGVTGNVYFDKHGNAVNVKSLAVGYFQNQHFISALTQLQPMSNFRGAGSEKAEDTSHILHVNDDYMYKTNVVYTGIDVHEVTDIDIGNLAFTLDFSLWFRYRGQSDPANIEFLNATEPIHLGAPVYETSTDSFSYRVYSVKGRFRADTLSMRPVLGEHVLGMSFCHRDLALNNLIYVTDVLGMGLTQEMPLIEKLRKSQVFSMIRGWSATQSWLFQDIAEKPTQGKPKYLGLQKAKLDYSRFNFGIQIKRNTFTFRRLISGEPSKYLLIVSLILLVLTFFAGRYQRLGRLSKLFWFLQTLFTFFLILSAEGFALDQLRGKISTYYLEYVILGFDILWWLVPAFFLNRAVEVFAWKPLEERTGRAIPNLVRRMAAFLIYTLVFFCIVAFVFDQKLTSLLATSGVFAMIIGLAIQINISNIFSGIAINLERPFRIGDWVRIGGFSEGKVMDITWRTTRLQTRDDCILSIPNSQAAEASIRNFSYPDERYKLIFTVQVDPVHPPARVRKILTDALLSAERVLSKPPPAVRYLGLNKDIHSQSTAWAADYLILCEVNNYGKKMVNLEAVTERIWNHLNRAGISPVIQRQELLMFREKGKSEAGSGAYPFAPPADASCLFSDEAKASLDEQMHVRRFSAGETVFQQGSQGDSMFTIMEGVVGVNLHLESGKTAEVARLGAGHFFGEMSLLTGELRSATIIAITDTLISEISKADIEPFIKAHPEVSDVLTHALGRRKKQVETRKKQEQDASARTDNGAEKNILHRIGKWFGL